MFKSCLIYGEIGKEDATAWQTSPEVMEFMTRSGKEWGAAYAASGADADVVEATTAATTGFCTGA
ncbi:hypothetical protein [Streptomyces sp. NPDC048473]|uniref:hypothetical protein n=1 Tax=Streptomyces sp. NPDC048473 TaxID=3365556 RepID=UPI003714CEA9